VYITDVKATNGRLMAIELPDELQPQVAYGAAIVKGAHDEKAARDFVDGLLHGPGAQALRQAGFGPPPA
jgi:molybdate transport system substrate-binding protein